jgi:DNA polymerase sigma
MATPVNLNQVIYQTPTVEKIQQAEHQNPEQAQRHTILIDHPEQLRKNTETVPNSKDTKHSKEVDNREKQEKKRKKREKKEREKNGSKTSQESQPAGTDNEQGRIVNVIV